MAMNERTGRGPIEQAFFNYEDALNTAHSHCEPTLEEYDAIKAARAAFGVALKSGMALIDQDLAKGFEVMGDIRALAKAIEEFPRSRL